MSDDLDEDDDDLDERDAQRAQWARQNAVRYQYVNTDDVVYHAMQCLLNDDEILSRWNRVMYSRRRTMLTAAYSAFSRRNVAEMNVFVMSVWGPNQQGSGRYERGQAGADAAGAEAGDRGAEIRPEGAAVVAGRGAACGSIARGQES